MKTDQPIAPAVQELPDIIWDGFTAWAAHLHDADPLTVAHVAEDVEYLPPSPVTAKMRAQLDADYREQRRSELRAMFRHAAANHDMHHAAALAEINALRPGMSDACYREAVADILTALYEVENEQVTT